MAATGSRDCRNVRLAVGSRSTADGDRGPARTACWAAVCVCSGSGGGHIDPAVTLAFPLRRKFP